MVLTVHSKIPYKPTKSDESFVEVDEGSFAKKGETLVLKRNGRCSLARVLTLTLLSILVITGLVCLTRFIYKVKWITEERPDDSYLKELPVSSFEKSDNSTIFWNFKTGYQTVRHGLYTCYIFKMDNSSANSFRMPKEKKKVTNNVYEVNPDITELKESMAKTVGVPAYLACKDNRIFWLAPYASENVDDVYYDHHDVGSNAEDDYESAGKRRRKRNIRSCRTSCCHRVCCCDVHRFIWETVEEFSCNHVCNRCSKFYHPVIQKIC